jgi:high-affinity iron transporter
LIAIINFDSQRGLRGRVLRVRGALRRTLVAVVCSAVGAAAAPAVRAQDAASLSPRFILNLLDYVSTDYAGAVSADGRVLSAAEYGEQSEFVASALQAARTLPETRDSRLVIDAIAALRERVEQRAAPAEVAAAAQQAKAAVIEVAHVQVAPERWPSLQRGRALFAQPCAACHGSEGRGDGPAGAALDPKPADFHAAKMDEISPFQAFNAIRVGVPGTAMAAFPSLSDRDVWDLAFYVVSLRHGRVGSPDAAAASRSAAAPDELTRVATLSDRELRGTLAGSEPERQHQLAALRLYSQDGAEARSLVVARSALREAGADYRAGRRDSAKARALQAYLDGVEPAEPELRARDAPITAALEERFAAVRRAIETGEPPEHVEASIASAEQALDRAAELLRSNPFSPWVTFLIAAGILLREGFEAVLVVIALLAVLRAAGARSAALWVHAGWVLALGVGALAWIFSGWLMRISGAQREIMEAFTSFLAVLVLLSMGFWLHSKTEIHRWRQFIDVRVKTALAGGNLLGLAGIAFMAVFREAFETVLFLRAAWLEGGAGAGAAMALAVAGALAVVLASSWVFLRYSARLPVPKVFAFSAALMGLLSVILVGKGIHALQETGWVGATSLLRGWRWDTLGIYPTRETIVAQTLVFAVALLLWFSGKRPARALARAQGRRANGL